MRSTLIVVTPPSLDYDLRLVEAVEPVHVQAFIAKRSVEGFDVTVVGRFTWPTEVDVGPMPVCSQVEKASRELGAVVDEQILRLPACGDETIKCSHHVLRAQPASNLDR